MTNIDSRLKALHELGQIIKDYLNSSNNNKSLIKLADAVEKASYSNSWFSVNYINLALKNIADILVDEKLFDWIKGYRFDELQKPKIIGLVMAGNLPLVGFHDFLSVLVSGHIAKIKLSSKDSVLLPTITDILIDIEPSLNKFIIYEDAILNGFDAVIATGSGNSSRYFDYYFGKYPHIIRRNRNSIAVIHNEDSDEVLNKIGFDITAFYGLGCRSVSKVYFPIGYDIPRLIRQLDSYSFLRENYKYFNNYEFNKSIYLINKVPHLDNGFILLKQDNSLASPVSVVHYDFYNNYDDLMKEIQSQSDHIQCVVSSASLNFDVIEPGKSQSPQLTDWADGVDVLSFLKNLM